MAELRELFAHPDSVQRLERLLDTLLPESHRGALLVGSAEAESCLQSLFQAIMPKSVGAKCRKSLFGHGTLGTFSAKITIARVTRLLPRELCESLDALRALRNKAAHRSGEFSVKAVECSGIYAFAEGGPQWVPVRATEAMMHSKFGGIMEKIRADLAKFELSTDGMEEKVLALIQASHEELERQAVRWGLAFGIACLCAAIDYHRESLSVALDGERTFGAHLRQPRPALPGTG